MKLLLLAAAIVPAACGCAGHHRPVVKPLAETTLGKEWLILDEPMKNAQPIGDTWNGTTADTGCFTFSTVVDTTGTIVIDAGSDKGNASLGAKILHLIGLDASLSSAKSWTLTARGARLAIAQDLEPRFDDHCQVKHNDVPRYPAVAALIGYDSLIYQAIDTGGKYLKLSSLDSSSAAKAQVGITIKDSASKTYITRTGDVWVGMRLIALKPDSTRVCEWTALPGQVTTCLKEKGFNRTILVSRLDNGKFVVHSLNSAAPNPAWQIDTVDPGFPVTSGLGIAATGTFGEWYSITIQPDTESRMQIQITKHKYQMESFSREADREKLNVFLRQ